MSWETRLFTWISYNRKTYNHKYEVVSDIEQLDNLITFCKNKLRNLVMMTEPQKFCGEDDPLYYLENNYSEVMEELEECIIERDRLHILLGSWDECHNKEGLAINPPDNINYDTAFLDGDFILTVKHPTNESLL